MKSTLASLALLMLATGALMCPAMTTKPTPLPKTQEGCWVLIGDKGRWVNPCPVSGVMGQR